MQFIKHFIYINYNCINKLVGLRFFDFVNTTSPKQWSINSPSEFQEPRVELLTVLPDEALLDVPDVREEITHGCDLRRERLLTRSWNKPLITSVGGNASYVIILLFSSN